MFRLGDVVRHKLGGNKMMVVDLDGEGRYTVAFVGLSDERPREVDLAETSLDLVDLLA